MVAVSIDALSDFQISFRWFPPASVSCGTKIDLRVQREFMAAGATHESAGTQPWRSQPTNITVHAVKVYNEIYTVVLPIRITPYQFRQPYTPIYAYACAHTDLWPWALNGLATSFGASNMSRGRACNSLLLGPAEVDTSSHQMEIRCRLGLSGWKCGAIYDRRIPTQVSRGMERNWIAGSRSLHLRTEELGQERAVFYWQIG
jgi:hypothetical protein